METTEAREIAPEVAAQIARDHLAKAFAKRAAEIRDTGATVRALTEARVERMRDDAVEAMRQALAPTTPKRRVKDKDILFTRSVAINLATRASLPGLRQLPLALAA